MKTKMSDDDVRICARLITETIIGHSGTVKTREFSKEKQIIERVYSTYNRLARGKASVLAIAKILSELILDQCLATVEARQRLPPLDESFRLLTP